jgi:hypothetical protein
MAVPGPIVGHDHSHMDRKDDSPATTARRLRGQEVMISRRARTLALTAAAVLAVGVRGAAGADGPGQHGRVSHWVVTIDRAQVHPSALTMKKDDVLEFVNYSASPMMLVFTQPQDHSDTARCHVAALGPGRELAPDAFIWASGYEPAAIIPPRRFVNICSLAPGQYVFVTREVGTDAVGPLDNLAVKGTVTVE